MSTFHESTYLVDTRDTDPLGQCRPSSLLSMLQESATQAAIALDISRERMLERYNCFWMLARIWFRLDRPLFWDDRLTLKTWHRGGKGAAMYRDYDLLVDGTPVGEAVSTWVLADQDTRKLIRLGSVAEFQGTDGGTLCKDKQLSRLKLPGAMTPAGSRTLYYSDADVNRHVNNARYADYLCDALRLEELGKGRRVSSMQIGFLAECRPGETLTISTAQAGGLYYVHGADEAGVSRFDGCLSLEDLPCAR